MVEMRGIELSHILRPSERNFFLSHPPSHPSESRYFERYFHLNNIYPHF